MKLHTILFCVLGKPALKRDLPCHNCACLGPTNRNWDRLQMICLQTSRKKHFILLCFLPKHFRHNVKGKVFLVFQRLICDTPALQFCGVLCSVHHMANPFLISPSIVTNPCKGRWEKKRREDVSQFPHLFQFPLNPPQIPPAHHCQKQLFWSLPRPKLSSTTFSLLL